MSETRLSRRLFLQIAALSPLSAGSALADTPKPRPTDQGIGGTGLPARRKGGEDDHGIGGTGVFGRIQRFGSIYVNGLRIRYPRNVAVFIDGRPAGVGAMRIGHVVRAALSGPPDDPQTRRIDITSEVVGRIERLEAGSMTVLSQSVDLGQVAGRPKLKAGMTVAVFGIRAPDGRIVASRVESRPRHARFLLRGVVERAGAALKIGGLTIARPAGSLAGKRVEAVIAQTPKGLKLLRIGEERLVPGLVSGRVIVETVRRSREETRARPGRPPAGGPFERAYVDFRVGPDGRASPMHGLKGPGGPFGGPPPPGQRPPRGGDFGGRAPPQFGPPSDGRGKPPPDRRGPGGRPREHR